MNFEKKQSAIVSTTFFQRFTPPKIPAYIKRIEQFFADSKLETLEAKDLLLELLKDNENKHGQEKKSLKPESFCQNRHLNFCQQFTQPEAPPFNLTVFFQKLSEYSQDIRPEDIKEDRLFARIVAWLFYFEPFLIAQNIKIPANFEQTLEMYQFDYLLRLIESEIKANSPEAIELLPTFFCNSNLSSKQHALIINTLLPLTKNNNFKNSIIEVLNKLATIAKLDDVEGEKIVQNLLSQILSISKEKNLKGVYIDIRNLSALLGAFLNFRNTNIPICINTMLAHFDANSDLMTYAFYDLVTSLTHINEQHCERISNKLMQSKQILWETIRTLVILGASSNINRQNCHTIINFLFKLKLKENPIIPISALKEIFAAKILTFSNEQYKTFIIALLEKSYQSETIRDLNDTMGSLETLITNATMLDKDWQDIFQFLLEKLNPDNNATHKFSFIVLNSLAINSRKMNDEQWLTFFNFSSEKMHHHDIFLQSGAIMLLGKLTTDLRMNNNQRQEFFNALLVKLKHDASVVREVATYALEMFTTGHRINDSQWSNMFRSLLNILNLGKACGTAIRLLGNLTADRRMSDTQGKQTFEALLKQKNNHYMIGNNYGMTSQVTNAISILLDQPINKHYSDLISNLLEEFEQTDNFPNHDAKIAILLELSQNTHVDINDRQAIKLAFLEKYKTIEQPNQELLIGLWQNPDAKDVSYRQMVIQRVVDNVTNKNYSSEHEITESIKPIWGLPNTTLKERDILIESLLAKHLSVQQEEKWRFVVIFKYMIEDPNITFNETNYNMIVEFFLAKLNDNNYQVRKVAEYVLCDCLTLTSLNSSLFYKIAITLNNKPVAQLKFIFNIKEQSKNIERIRENEETLQLFLYKDVSNLIVQYTGLKF